MVALRTPTASSTWPRPPTTSRALRHHARGAGRVRAAHHQKAAGARSARASGGDRGREIARPQGELVDKDDHLLGHDAEGLAKLPPAFGKDGFVTAGNASASWTARPPSWSRPRGARRSATSRPGPHRLVGVVGVDPDDMGIGPVPAIAPRSSGPASGSRTSTSSRSTRPSRTVPRRREGAGPRPREDQRERRRDRARPPARRDRHAISSSRPLRAAPPEEALRRRVGVHRRRSGIAIVRGRRGVTRLAG